MEGAISYYISIPKGTSPSDHGKGHGVWLEVRNEVSWRLGLAFLKGSEGLG